MIIQLIMFISILLYASWYDIKNRIVPNHVLIFLLITGLLNVSLFAFLSSSITAIVLFLTALFSGGIGGGDVKFAIICSFIVHGFYGLSGIVSVVIGLLLVLTINTIRKRKLIPLIPYLSIGYILTICIGGF